MSKHNRTSGRELNDQDKYEIDEDSRTQKAAIDAELSLETGYSVKWSDTYYIWTKSNLFSSEDPTWKRRGVITVRVWRLLAATISSGEYFKSIW